MAFLKLLEEGRFFEIQRSLKPREDLKDQALSYSGSLRPHYNPNMVLLLTHPLERSGKIYEFRLEDILYAQDLPSISFPVELRLNRHVCGSGVVVPPCACSLSGSAILMKGGAKEK